MIKFTININSEWIYVRGTEKLVHSSQYLFSLDGKEHAIVMPQFIPLASPVRSISYICTIDRVKKCIRIDLFGIYTPNPKYRLRITRDFRASHDGVELYVVTNFELEDQTNRIRESIGTINNQYIRVWRKQDSSNLLKSEQKQIEEDTDIKFNSSS